MADNAIEGRLHRAGGNFKRLKKIERIPIATTIATKITSKFSRQCDSHVTGVSWCSWASSASASVLDADA